MNLTITDAQEAYMFARAMSDEWKAEFMTQWYAPIARTMIGLQFSLLPQQAVSNMRPELIDEVVSILGRSK